MAPKTDEPKFLALKTPLAAPQSANILGRVVRRYDNLAFDYTPESPAATLTPARFDRFVVIQHQDNARFTAQASATSSGFAQFFARASGSTTSVATVTVTAPRVTTRQLVPQVDYFAALKADPAVCRKLLSMCDFNETVYLIVGTMSARGARFDWSTRAGRSTGGGATIPLGAAAGVAAATGIGVPTPELLGALVPDLEVGYHRSRLAGGTASFTTAEEQGEQVFAVVCRAIKRTWHGLGNDMCMKTSQPEYTGGVHYGSDDSDEDEDEDEDERRDEAGLSEVNVMALADELELGELVDWSN